jgi:hypothetical protein
MSLPSAAATGVVVLGRWGAVPAGRLCRSCSSAGLKMRFIAAAQLALEDAATCGRERDIRRGQR